MRELVAIHALKIPAAPCFNVYDFIETYTYRKAMRTNIVIDDELMSQVLKLTGIRTKREAVEQGLKALLKLKEQEQIRRYRGKFDWDGNLDELRTDT
jgi:Arc/MetJ family transcription regulator